jgi:hypothetical protein
MAAKLTRGVLINRRFRQKPYIHIYRVRWNHFALKWLFTLIAVKKLRTLVERLLLGIRACNRGSGQQLFSRSISMLANKRSAQTAALISAFLIATTVSSSALPPTPNTSGLSPEQCYRKDSDCTGFCGQVSNPDYRYDCFSICDRMLDRCLDTGDWTDSMVEPNSGKPKISGQLSGRLLRMLMILADTDGDGAVSPKEMEFLKSKVFKGPSAEVDQKPPRPADK